MLTPQQFDELDHRGRPQLADEDEDALGMRTNEDEGDVEEETTMRLGCDACGEVSRVLPPKGFRLAEDEDEEEAGPRGLRYACAACGEVARARVPRGYRLVRMTEAARTFRESYWSADR